jgi:hypothetical protein
MKNSIDVRVEFSFKGETYDLCSHIDLDARLTQHDRPPSFYQVLARDHNIDTISYLYEVMQEEDIEYSNAQGIAAKFLRDGEFDMAAFTDHWREYHIAVLVRPIAQQVLGIDDLEQHAKIRDALVMAYKLGRC